MQPPHTPPKPVDVAAEFPFLAGRSRTTVRLHPRPGSPAPTDSSIGGDLWWPVAEPWPVHRHRDGIDLPYLPIAQLWRRDVAELPWPVDADLFQLLWCPGFHDDYEPDPLPLWRDSTTDREPGTLRQEAVRAAVASVDMVIDVFVPRPCQVWPERVTEFPDWWELTDAQRATIEAWEEGRDLEYAYHLGAAPGTKAGGWPEWMQHPEWPRWPAGHRMAHLMTVASREFDGESGKTWRPPGDEFLDSGPTGLTLGDDGDYYVFACATCPDRPVATRFQSS